MRTLAAVMCLAFWHAVSAGPLCGDSKPDAESLLSQEQWNAVRGAALSGKDLVGDTVLQEAVAVQRRVLKSGAVSHGKRSMRSAVPIPWEQARKLILLGAVQSILQSVGSEVVLTTISGRVFTSVEPNGGDTRDLVNAVDPCHVFIDVWAQ